MAKFFPFYKQADFKDYGVICLKIIAKYYGRTLNIQTLRELSETTIEVSNLFYISEGAEQIGFGTLGVKLSLEELLEAPLPCILHWNKNHCVVLYDIVKNKKQYTSDNIQYIIKISDPAFGLLEYTKEEFLKFWIGNNANETTEEGIALLLEPTPSFYTSPLTSKWGTDEKENFGFSFTLFVLLGLSLWLQPFGLIPFLYQLLSVAGIVTAVFIIQEELGNPNSIASKVCNGTDNTVSCNSVINSKQGKLLFGVSFSDFPIAFFGVSFLGMTFNYNFYSLVGLLSVLALPVIFYSIYLQKFVLKKWCILCLIISAIIILQAILFVFTPKVFDWKTMVVFVMLLIISAVLWLPLKNILKQKNTLSRENNQLKRLKRDFNIFDLLLNKSEVALTNHLQGIKIGNQNAPVLLELFVSPNCGFCYKAYKECTELLEKQKEKIQLKVYFNLNLDNSDNPYLTVAKNIIQYYRETENTEPLNDWYLNEFPLEKWKQRWEKDNIIVETQQAIQEQFEYCTHNNLNYAPVVLVNGKLLPNEYRINELKYFISDLEEQKEKDLQSV